MTVVHVEVIVEEPSMEVAMRILLPRILGRTSFQVYSHQCKDELLKHLPDRLRAYSTWIPDDWRIVIIVDRDDDDCRQLKTRLEKMALNANLATKSSPNRQRFVIVNRLAIEELEAWYFGDWQAVQAAFPGVNANIPMKSSYRDPDAIKGGTWEAFERILKRTGYFKTGLRKIEAARSVAEHMEPNRNTSNSFRVLYESLLEMSAV